MFVTQDGQVFLQTAEVASLLHVSPKTVNRWSKEGKLPFIRTLGGHRRFPENQIREIADAMHGDTLHQGGPGA